MFESWPKQKSKEDILNNPEGKISRRAVLKRGLAAAGALLLATPDSISEGSPALAKIGDAVGKKLEKLAQRKNIIADMEKDMMMVEAEKWKKSLLHHVKRWDYLDKLAKETGSLAEALKIREERIKNLETVEIFSMDRETMIRRNLYPTRVSIGSDFMDKTVSNEMINESHRSIFGDGAELNGFYKPSVHQIAIRNDGKSETTIHEIGHAITRSNKDIPIDTEILFYDAYKESGDKKTDDYLKDPTELLTRKLLVDLEMSMIGIKKYKEKFTQEHYKRLMEEYDKGMLHRGSREFIDRIKPEYMEMIFNEIAMDGKMLPKNMHYA